jgi:uncharacterized protein
MASVDSIGSSLAILRQLHRKIDREVARLSLRHGQRLRCGRGCSSCCLDELSVTAIEAQLIAQNHAGLLANGTPHQSGSCAFLDSEGACRIYDDRPSVCRSQGLPLRVLFEDENDEIAEHRDICPLNLAGGPALGELDEDDCWLIGPVELELIELDRRHNGEGAPRVALRSLFANDPDPDDVEER